MIELSGVIALAVWLVVTVVVVLVASHVPGPGPSYGDRPRPVGADDESRPRAAVVVNPTKFDDVDAVHAMVDHVCTSEGWAAPLWLETTVDDPGTGQARQAMEAGADVVCALGGDGTVRSVAAALVGTDTPMGLLPGGTGNLLARNLGLPIDSIPEALRVALRGREERIDVGTINVAVPEETQDEPQDYVFLVMAGMGFDASVMADAPEKLKAQIGWPAYVVSGIKHLNGSRFDVEVTLDDGPTRHRLARTVLVGNVGQLQGGVDLLPDAEADDGWLDTVLLSPKGLMGWFAIAAHFATGARKGYARVEHHRCRTMKLRLGGTQEVQLDGDPIGPGGLVTIGVRPRSLRVRVS